MAQTLETKTYYRADIQGLRGVAVLLVVVYHTGFALPGGFIGVDMFFVISGFVITQVLIREYEETGRIKLGQFYARRARRLIPALSIVTIFTLLISLVAMSPFGEQQQIIKTAIASTFFAGNIHLFAMNSYDSLVNNPLRHLWSLGVEEQFYLLYPFLVVLLMRFSRRRFDKALTLTLSFLTIVSFGIGLLLTNGFEFGYRNGTFLESRFGFLWKVGFLPGGDWPTKFAFFGAPSRFWEISLGALTAIIAKQKPRLTLKRGSALLVLPVVLVIFSSLVFESSSLFPGFLALVPTIGTALLILFNHQSEVVSGFLRSRYLVNLGNVSYSLYLWHWPFIVFSRAIWPGSPHASVIAAISSIFPSVISYMFIEPRFQSPLANSKIKNFFGVCFLLVAPLMISSAAYKIANTGLGLPGLGNKQNFASDNFCGDAKSPEFQIYDCVFGETDARFSAVLFGDSTARSISDGVFAAVSELSGDLTISVSGGCKFYKSSFEKSEICINANLERFAYLKISKPDVVIMSNRQIFESCGVEPLRLTGLIFGEVLRTELSESSKRYHSELKETLKVVAGLGIPVISIEQIPWCGPSEPTLLRPQVESVLVSPESNLAQISLDVLRELTLSFKGNSVVQTKEVLCNKQTCDYFFEGQPLYADPAHLTAIGSMRLKPAIVAALKEVLEQP
jgi:peptidoglycan/LPS O-acetylase OafA/YrhL